MSYRKQWNKQQTEFRDLLLSFEDHDQAILLFLRQHARHHAAAMAGSESWSFEDEVFDDLSDEAARKIPANEEHSIVWLLWHIARIEDVTMNVLVAGRSQILYQENWLDRLSISYVHTGNGMPGDDLQQLSSAIDIQQLRDYRLAVGRQTMEIVQKLSPSGLKTKVDPERIQKLIDQKAVLENSLGLLDYWGRKNVAGLLLMPPTRHCFVHLNEAARLKKKAV